MNRIMTGKLKELRQSKQRKPECSATKRDKMSSKLMAHTGK